MCGVCVRFSQIFAATVASLYTTSHARTLFYSCVGLGKCTALHRHTHAIWGTKHMAVTCAEWDAYLQFYCNFRLNKREIFSHVMWYDWWEGVSSPFMYMWIPKPFNFDIKLEAFDFNAFLDFTSLLLSLEKTKTIILQCPDYTFEMGIGRTKPQKNQYTTIHRMNRCEKKGNGLFLFTLFCLKIE